MWTKLERVKGAHHELEKLAALPSDDCEVLLVSSRTLAILANLAQHEATWAARYMVDYQPGNLARPVRESDPEYDLYADIVRNFRLEVIPVTCDLTGALSAITAAINKLTDQLAISQTIDLCCPEGTGTEPPPADTGAEDIPIGPGETYEDYDTYLDDKCSTANFLVDDLIGLITEFNIRDIADYAAGSIAITWVVVAEVLGLFFIGTTSAIIIGVTGAIVALILGPVIFDLGDLATVLNAKKDQLKQALYCANDTSEAKTAFLQLLDGEGLSLLEIEFVGLFLNNRVLGTLFDPVAQTIGYDGGYVCTPCAVACEWRIAPVGMFPNTFQWASQTVAGSGTVDNTGASFTISSVPVLDTADGLTKHALGVCTWDFYYRWLEAGQPHWAILPTTGIVCECEDGDGLEHLNAFPGASSVKFRNCLSGQWSDAGAGAFAPNPNPDLIFLGLYRFTGGAFSMDFRVV